MTDVDLVLESPGPDREPVRSSASMATRRPPTGWVRRAFVAIGMLVLIALPFLLPSFRLQRYSELIALSLGVLGLNIVTGQTGLISLGHGAFVGLGAFSMVVLLDDVGLPFLIALPVAFLITSTFGAVVGLPALRIRGIYLALVTMGLGIVFPILVKKFPSLTGGVSGRGVEFQMMPPGWTGLSESDAAIWQYFVCLAICVALFVVTHQIMDSTLGRSMKAVRDNETAAAIFGINLTVTKLTSFALSAGLAGVAGALQTILTPGSGSKAFVKFDQFTVFLSFRLYAAAVLGGLSELIGAVYGVLALLVIPALNEILGLFESDALVFGLGLILLTYVSPDGIAGLIRRRSSKTVGPGEGNGGPADGV